MPQIYLVPPHHCLVFGKEVVEGVYGETSFTPAEMKALVSMGCATWFDASSPHMANGNHLGNVRPDTGLSVPVYTILARAEVWKFPWKSESHRKRYFALRSIFARVDDPYHRAGDLPVSPFSTLASD